GRRPLRGLGGFTRVHRLANQTRGKLEPAHWPILRKAGPEIVLGIRVFTTLKILVDVLGFKVGLSAHDVSGKSWPGPRDWRVTWTYGRFIVEVDFLRALSAAIVTDRYSIKG